MTAATHFGLDSLRLAFNLLFSQNWTLVLQIQILSITDKILTVHKLPQNPT